MTSLPALAQALVQDIPQPEVLEQNADGLSQMTIVGDYVRALLYKAAHQQPLRYSELTQYVNTVRDKTVSNSAALINKANEMMQYIFGLEVSRISVGDEDSASESVWLCLRHMQSCTVPPTLEASMESILEVVGSQLEELEETKVSSGQTRLPQQARQPLNLTIAQLIQGTGQSIRSISESMRNTFPAVTKFITNLQPNQLPNLTSELPPEFNDFFNELTLRGIALVIIVILSQMGTGAQQTEVTLCEHLSRYYNIDSKKVYLEEGSL